MQEHFFLINKIVKGISTNIKIVLFLVLRGPLIFSYANNFHHLHFLPLVSHVFICLCQLLAFFGLTLFRAVSTQMGVNSNDIIRQIFCQLSPTNNDGYSKKWTVNSPTDNNDKKKRANKHQMKNAKQKMTNGKNEWHTKLGVGIVAKTKVYPEPNLMS